ncbi:MAG TPA: hypothetical protein VF126_14440, partial [Acidobacteriaceae bacterium]
TCYHGGQPGVSDAFASALWAADYLLLLAQSGCAGVNLHGGGEGYYAPITGEPNATKLRPEYYGMLLAQQFAGATFVNASVSEVSDGVNAYAARQGDTVLLAVVNKTASPLHLRSQHIKAAASEQRVLTASSLDSKEDVHIAKLKGPTALEVPAYSAALWETSA